MVGLHPLALEVGLLHCSLRNAQIFFRSGQIKLRFDQIDLRDSALRRQSLHPVDQVAAGLGVAFAEFHFAFCLFDFAQFDVELRLVSGFVTLNAFSLGPQIFA